MQTLDAKKEPVHLVHDLEHDLSRYLFTVTLINSGLGLAIGLAMAGLGVPNLAPWGVMAALLNYVPYLGAIVGACVVTLVAAATGTGGIDLLIVPLVLLTLTSTEGQALTPLILGKRLMLNPVAIFIGVIFWGWLWGVPGALLAVPLLVSLQIICAPVPAPRPAGELLGT